MLRAARTVAAAVLVAAACGGAAAAGPPAAGRLATAPLVAGPAASDRVEALLAQLTLAEKVSLMYGIARPAGVHSVGYVPGVPRLGIPPLLQADGPLGVHDSCFGEQAPGNCYQGPSTAFASESSLAASFDPALAQEVGATIGAEARARGVDVVYGPGINLVRVPQGGRNFEYFSEDPYLTGMLAAAWTTGLQSRDVAAEAKHFLLNEQENERKTASSNADERTLRELYLPPWQQFAAAGGAAAMCGNNRANGTYACENSLLLRQILEGELGFDGMVGSDYAATHDALASVNGGLDQSFTGLDWGAYYDTLADLVQSGQLSEDVVDEHVRRILTLMERIGMLDPGRDPGAVDVAADGAVARRAAEQGAVLLKNDRAILPLSPSIGSVAVLGQYAAVANPGGGGSSRVPPYYTVSPVEGIRARLGAGASVTSADGSDLAAAAALARAADVAVVVVNDVEKEGADRASIDLPGNQDALITAVRQANPRTVVVLETGSAVTMPWLAQTHAVLQLWYPGQEGGTALAALLFGDVDPSGRLPITFPKSLADDCCHTAPRYPAVDGNYDYTEGLQVGYRWYDAQDVAPLFPFGYGLSYTTFRYSHLTVTSRTVRPGLGVTATLDVTNTGARTGTATPQAYLAFPAGSGEPPQRLVAAAKVTLAPGQTKTVPLTVAPSAFEFWSTAQHTWALAPGDYTLYAGASSRNHPLRSVIHAAHTGGHSIAVAAPASIGPDLIAVSLTVGNDSADPMTTTRYALDLPAGWTATLTSPAPRQVAAGATVTVTYAVRAPAGAGPGTYVLTGRASWTGRAPGSAAYAVSLAATA